MIADPAAKPAKSVSFSLLERRPELAAGRAEAMMTGLERAAGAKAYARDNGRSLADLMARLPDERFAPLGPRLIAFFAPPFEKYDWRADATRLLARLGDLGADALPVLMRGFEQRNGVRRAQAWALEGICRIGASARDVAGPALHLFWAARPQPPKEMTGETYRWAYVAMLRLGMKEQAGPVDQRYYGKWWREKYATVTPASSMEACDIR